MTDDNSDTRPRGILSTADRRFLRGEYTDKSSAARSQRKNAIKERTRAALLDFSPLFAHLSDDVRREVFREEDPDTRSNRILVAITVAISFLYLGLDERIDDDPTGQFETMVSHAIKRAHAKRGETIESMDVSINVELSGSLDGLDKPLNELPETTLEQLLSSDRITIDEYTEVIKERA